jgi:hypothetical protein
MFALPPSASPKSGLQSGLHRPSSACELSNVINDETYGLNAMQMRSNWGYTTHSWLAELDRRIRELSAIIAAFEARYAI